MVPKDGNSASGDQDQDLGVLSSFGDDAAMQPNMDTPNAMDSAVDDQHHGFEPGTDGPTDEPFEQGAGEEHRAEFEANDFGEGIDFGDLDTAGDELSGYAQEIGNAGLGENDDLGANDISRY